MNSNLIFFRDKLTHLFFPCKTVKLDTGISTRITKSKDKTKRVNVSSSAVLNGFNSKVRADQEIYIIFNPNDFDVFFREAQRIGVTISLAPNRNDVFCIIDSKCNILKYLDAVTEVHYTVINPDEFSSDRRYKNFD